MTISRAEYKKRFAERQGWIDAVQARRDLSPTARLIGGRIGMHKNLETGQCNPGAGTLAAEAGVAERSAFRAIAELERKHCITVERTRGGAQNNANSYTLLPQTEAGTGDNVSGVGAPVRGDNHDIQRVTPCQANNKKNNIGNRGAKAPPVPLGERDALARESASRIGAGALRAPPDQESSKRTRDEEKEIAAEAQVEPASEGAAGAVTVSPVVPLDVHRTFRELLALWQRGWPADDTPKVQAIAQQEFAKACREVTPGDILDAAKVWVAAADAARFLPGLPQWLAACGWEKPPPTKPPKRAAPNGQRGYQRKVKPDVMRMALKMGGYQEDENGKLQHPDGDDGCSFDWRASL